MKIAVTGANGHVGMNLCQSLLERNHQVRALIHQNTLAIKNIPVEIVRGDVLDGSSVHTFLKDVDVVFHLAARISITGDPDGMVNRINTEGTRNVLGAALESGVKRLIHFSSIHAFQQRPFDRTLDETRPLVDHVGFAYDRSKAEGERAVNEAVKKGLDAVILSPTAIIGPADFQPSLTGKAVVDLYRHKIPALVPGGYDWVDVRDVVTGAIRAMENGRKGEKYLLSGHWHSLKELSALIQEHSHRKIVDTVLPVWLARVGLPFISLYSKWSRTKPLYTRESLTIIQEGSRLISNAKARKELGFDPRPLTDTIRDLMAWFMEHGKIN